MPNTPSQITRILYVAASPKHLGPVSTKREFQALQDALSHVGGVELHALFCATATDLHDALIRDDFQIVHLVAHGSEEGAALENDGSDWKGLLGREIFEALLRGHPSLRCVVLNACYSASWFPRTLGPAVVVMHGAVGDAAAVAFSEGFYAAIGAGRSLPQAFEAGKQRVPIRTRDQPFEPAFLPDCRGVIGIRTRAAFFQQLRDRCLFFCDLGRWFPDSAPPDWLAAEQELRAFFARADVSDALADDGDRMIHLDCPATMALLAGKLVGPQAAMGVFHRVGNSTRKLWMPNHRKPPPDSSPWTIERTGEANAGKLVVSVSVANPTRPDIERELARSSEPCLWVDFRPLGGADQNSVQGADHANVLARDLAQQLQRLQAETEVDRIHLYPSVPNPLMFLLGQKGAVLGRLQLYEFDRLAKTYSPSLLIE